MMAKRIFISGELDGVNWVDDLMSTGLTGVGFNGKNVQVKVIQTIAKLKTTVLNSLQTTEYLPQDMVVGPQERKCG